MAYPRPKSSCVCLCKNSIEFSYGKYVCIIILKGTYVYVSITMKVDTSAMSNI